ncbi:alpha/beta fold hydrolase [Marinicella meishanensis]|uniref:alpha/beta fold hydrolase n=1 Tax=Marinicella meishanensis TaxID=2873263 RepID=UPI001CBD3590|nr:alpha/beta hydrolase [Marinicella sp. NBU2979]
MNPLPFTTWGEPSSDTPIYFAHANGYPPGSYQSIIDALLAYRPVVAYHQRPLWQPTPEPKDLHHWQQLADDVIRFFDQQRLRNVVAVGHSLGSVTAFMAAQKRPDLIKALVMIEPVALPWLACFLTRVFPGLVKRRVSIIQKALRRPNRFESRQAAFDFHRKARAFQRLDDANLWHYINAGVHPVNGAYELTYPREWEARVYATATYFRRQLKTSTLPVLGMRGGHSDTISAAFWRQWPINPHHQFAAFPDYGHLLPLEHPAGVVQAMQPFLEQHL